MKKVPLILPLAAVAVALMLPLMGMGATFLAPELLPKPDPVKVVSNGLALPLSEKGVDFIQRHETGGRAYYEKRYTGIIWPGGASGATVGVGYDCGYNTRSQISNDWKGVAKKSEMNALLACSGAKGSRGRTLARRYRNAVHFTWHEAKTVFVKETLPRFTKLTKTAFRLRTDQLHPHSNSALVSLVFNRGGSVSGYRRRHMLNIRNHLAAGRYDRVDNEFLDMRVIWVGKGLDGLLRRRREEADLFAVGEIHRRKWGVPKPSD